MKLKALVLFFCVSLWPSCGAKVRPGMDKDSFWAEVEVNSSGEVTQIADSVETSEVLEPAEGTFEAMTIEVDDKLDACHADCVDKECGDDGCGGECGVCEPPDLCHLEPVCLDGQCLEGEKLSCEDGNPCTHDLCAKGTGCFYIDSSEACDDGDVCTVGDKCKGGVCVPGEDQCCYSDEECDQTADCNGIQACIDGACQLVEGSQVPCSDDPDDCVVVIGCDAETGVCIEEDLPWKTPCDDGIPCTTGDQCSNGVCQVVNNLCCQENTDCDQISDCNGIQTCIHGMCQLVEGSEVECVDDDPTDCEFFVCNENTGNCGTSVVVGAPCDDDDPCTKGHCSGSGDCMGIPLESGPCSQPIPLTWIPIPGGTFEMGCTWTDSDFGWFGCDEDAVPLHEVSLPPFEIAETEVTQAQYEAVLGVPAPASVGYYPNYPADEVTWAQAQAFCTSAGGRLCSEAEWEYAARGGTATSYACVEEPDCLYEVAWFYWNSNSNIHGVKGKNPNPFGLFDMLGNANEWTADWYSAGYYSVSPEGSPKGPEAGSKRVFRSGDYQCGWLSNVPTTWGRGPMSPEQGIGFRCCRTTE